MMNSLRMSHGAYSNACTWHRTGSRSVSSSRSCRNAICGNVPKSNKNRMSGKRCLEAVIANLRVDDIIKARHDTETAKKLRLQAQFYHRVKLPFDS